MEKLIESVLFRSRWLLAVFYLGLLVSLIVLMIKFFQKLFDILMVSFEATIMDIELQILSLIDMTLLANLLVMIMFAGYQHFVSVLVDEESKDKPRWLDQIDFSGMKLKVMGSIVTISAVRLLQVFFNMEEWNPENVQWMITIHITIVVSGLLLAVMDWVAHKSLSGDWRPLKEGK
jgi:uncharacterized protein (TIGR00645 family)